MRKKSKNPAPALVPQPLTRKDELAIAQRQRDKAEKKCRNNFLLLPAFLGGGPGEIAGFVMLATGVHPLLGGLLLLGGGSLAVIGMWSDGKRTMTRDAARERVAVIERAIATEKPDDTVPKTPTPPQPDMHTGVTPEHNQPEPEFPGLRRPIVISGKTLGR